MPFQPLAALDSRLRQPVPRARMRLSGTGPAIRLAALGARHKGALILGPRHYPCTLGRSGRKTPKQEGDGTTPRGIFPLRWLAYRADRRLRPRTGLACCLPLRPWDGWCDDAGSSLYNRPVPHPAPVRHEAMWRDDRLYDLVIGLGCNDRPPRRGRGSAIFLHIMAADGHPTEGCIAVAPEVMAKLLPVLSRAVRIVV